MTSETPTSAVVSVIAAMVTPALLILASASLVASALVRMARVVDRARTLITAGHDGAWDRYGLSKAELRETLARHERRARYAEHSILFLYAAVVLFVLTCLAIAAQGTNAIDLGRWPVALAVTGALLVLAGGALMVAESRLSGRQIEDEIRRAVRQLEE